MILQKYKQFIMNDAMASTRIAVDTETESLVDKTMVGFSFAYEKNGQVISYYVPVRHNKFDNMPLEDVQKVLKVILYHSQLVFHNYVFDAMVFAKFGIPVRGLIIEDTMIIAHLLDENDNQGLKPCALRYCRHKMKHFKEICGSGKSRISFADIDKEIAVKYGSEDSEYTLKLFNILYPKLIKDKGLYRIYTLIEQPLLEVVKDMQINGITIDNIQVARIREECQKHVFNVLEKIEYLMPNVNLNSPKQLRNHFVDKKRLKPLAFSAKTKQPSVNKEFFEHYETDKRCPEIKALLAYKKYNKILSTFIPALTTGINSNYKIYAQFRQSGTKTGRFSSSNPDMQNIPRTTDEFDIRAAIIADEGHVFIGADYSQIELRLATHFSQEPHMVKVYREGGDIHQETANACGSTRQEAKTINFGLLYGMYYKTLAKLLEVDYETAIAYHEQFWKRYNVLGKFMDSVKKIAVNRGYTETLFGRKRHLTNEFFDKEPFQKSAELRSIANAIIQGSGADLMKLAMVDMYQPLKNIGARIVLTVHDECLVSCPKSKVKQGIKIVTDAMLKYDYKLVVPLEIDLKVGKNWSECHG